MWWLAGEPMGFSPGVDAAVQNGPIREHGDNPQHGFHAVSQGADNQQHHALRPLQEPDLAGGDESFTI